MDISHLKQEYEFNFAVFFDSKFTFAEAEHEYHYDGVKFESVTTFKAEPSASITIDPTVKLSQFLLASFIGVHIVQPVQSSSQRIFTELAATSVEVQLNNKAKVSLLNISYKSVFIVVIWDVALYIVPVSSAFISTILEVSKLATNHFTEANLEKAQAVQAGLISNIQVNFAKSFGFIAVILLVFIK